MAAHANAGSRGDVPAPVAILRSRASLPPRPGYLIVPFGADRVTAGITARTARSGDRWSISVELPSGRRDPIGMDPGLPASAIVDIARPSVTEE